jgi:phage anti-repressor protein
MSVDIVNLIESNPITKLTGNYQSKLVEKVKNNFTNYEQQLFLSSFYCYLKYDTKNDFVIDLDNVWQWLGFSQKAKGKSLLERHFKIEKDYVILLSQSGKTHGGHNKENFMLNVDTFKRMCLKAGTKKADEIHDYFIKLENIMFEIAKEECEELKQQLHQIVTIKNKETEDKLIKQKELDKEKFLLKEYDNINNFNYRVCELLMENELLKTKLDAIPQPNMNNELLAELIKTNKLLSDRLASLEHSNKEILNKLNNHETKVVTGFHQPNATVGPRLQKINPETLELIKVYETVTELMNENKNIKRPSIMKSIQENTIYCGFRWMVVERTLDPNNVNNIQPTKKTKIQSLGYIAKLNKEKTEILNVYLDRKTAAQCNGYQSSSALDNPVKKGTLTNGHYYILYDQFNQVNEELIKSFETIYGEPLLYNNGIGQYDVNTNQLTKEFGCKYDCIKELKMSDKTLAKSLKNNIPYNNYYYRELGAKLFVCSSL